ESNQLTDLIRCPVSFALFFLSLNSGRTIRSHKRSKGLRYSTAKSFVNHPTPQWFLVSLFLGLVVCCPGSCSGENGRRSRYPSGKPNSAGRPRHGYFDRGELRCRLDRSGRWDT